MSKLKRVWTIAALSMLVSAWLERAAPRTMPQRGVSQASGQSGAASVGEGSSCELRAPRRSLAYLL